MAHDVLIYADTERSAALRHELPLAIGDPFLYAEAGGRRAAVLSVLERDRVEALGLGIEIVAPEELGFDELLRAGRPRHEVELEVAVRAARRLGVRDALVPPEFPLTAERVRAAARAAAAEHGALLGPDAIVAPAAQGASGHEAGHGPLPAGVPIVVDLWPRDEASACHADMTRTFVIGSPPDDVRAMHALALEALHRVRGAARAGVTGAELFALACEPFERAGHPTRRTKAPGETLRDGFFHSLGHGVGLEVHEAPALGLSGEPLVPGDVIAVEPGTYRHGYGGVRLEDLLLVGDGGAEVLTSYPYDLAP
jgi:Xaa-Pro aminopeptidase